MAGIPVWRELARITLCGTLLLGGIPEFSGAAPIAVPENFAPVVSEPENLPQLPLSLGTPAAAQSATQKNTKSEDTDEPVEARQSQPEQPVPAPPSLPTVPSDDPPIPGVHPSDTQKNTPEEQSSPTAPSQHTAVSDPAILALAEKKLADCLQAGAALYQYGLDVDACAPALRPELSAWLHARPVLKAGQEQGTPLSVRTLNTTPDFTRVPAALYLLVENRSVLPKALRAPLAESQRVLQHTPLQGIPPDGPFLLRLHPQKPTTAPLLRWYITEGAAQGHALVLGSDADPETLRRRVAAWHILLRERPAISPQDDASPVPFLARPCNPGFLKALLPQLKGATASLFAGKGEGLWFAYPTPRGPQWHEVKGERWRAAPAPKDATLLLPAALSLTADYDKEYEAYMSRLLLHLKEGKQPSLEAATAFVRRVTTHINALPDFPGHMVWNAVARDRVLHLLWQAHGTLKENAVAHILLAPDATPLAKRTAAAQAVLGE